MKTKLEMMKTLVKGTLSEEERQYYLNNYMSEEEKEIGKPVFDMTDEEYDKYDVLVYNNSKGIMTGYDCPICKNKGNSVYLSANGYKVYVDCPCMKVRNNLARLERSGLGNLLDIYTFENYKVKFDWQNNVLKSAIDFIDSNGKCFAILGKTGSGKSHICTAISKELMTRGMDLKYMVWLDECIKLKQNKMNSEFYNSYMNYIKNVDVLYIDDFLKGDNNGQPTSADINLALEIINYRYNKSRTVDKRMITIISSEKTINEIISFDEALAGRIKELAGEWLIILTGDDKNYRFN